MRDTMYHVSKYMEKGDFLYLSKNDHSAWLVKDNSDKVFHIMVEDTKDGNNHQISVDVAEYQKVILKQLADNLTSTKGVSKGSFIFDEMTFNYNLDEFEDCTIVDYLVRDRNGDRVDSSGIEINELRCIARMIELTGVYVIKDGVTRYFIKQTDLQHFVLVPLEQRKEWLDNNKLTVCYVDFVESVAVAGSYVINGTISINFEDAVEEEEDD